MEIKSALNINAILMRLFLVGVFVYLAFVHSHGFIPHDEGLFIQAGNRMAAGQVPYRDFQIVYNPGSIYVNWLAFAVWGKSILASRIMAMINSVVTIATIMYLGRKTGNNKFLTGAIILGYAAWGPGHINFVWPVMFCITFGLLAVIFLWRGTLTQTNCGIGFGPDWQALWCLFLNRISG